VLWLRLPLATTQHRYMYKIAKFQKLHAQPMLLLLAYTGLISLASVSRMCYYFMGSSPPSVAPNRHWDTWSSNPEVGGIFFPFFGPFLLHLIC